MNRTASVKAKMSLAVAAGLFGLSAAAHAADYTWAVDSGNYSDSASWGGEGPPVSGDRAMFVAPTTPSPAQVNLTGGAVNSGGNVNGVAVDYNLNSNTLTVDGGTTAVFNDGVLRYVGPGTVNYTGSSQLRIGEYSNGDVQVSDGAVVNWSSSDTLLLRGNDNPDVNPPLTGVGVLTVNQGSQLILNAGTFQTGAYRGGDTVINIDGPGR